MSFESSIWEVLQHQYDRKNWIYDDKNIRKKRKNKEPSLSNRVSVSMANEKKKTSRNERLRILNEKMGIEL